MFFVSFSKTLMEDDSRGGRQRGGRCLEDPISARQAAAEADRSKRYLLMLDDETTRRA